MGRGRFGELPWDDYSIDYVLRGDRGGEVVRLKIGAGIAIDRETNVITFSVPPGRRLRPGLYRHGCVLTHLETGKKVQAFDGTVTITEGNI